MSGSKDAHYLRSGAVRRYQRGRWGAVEAGESLCRENGERKRGIGGTDGKAKK